MWSAAAAAARAVSVSVSPVPTPSLLSGRRGVPRGGRGVVSVRSSLLDFVGGDLVRPDLGKWLDDVEKHKALAIYPPHEGGYEGRYLNRLRYQGYYFLDLSARGLGDPETTLTKVHPVCPVLSKAELQFLAMLPDIRPKVRVIAEVSNWRSFVWKPLKQIAGLEPNPDAEE
ncbi:NAD(P)H-quinone oxidoreductase subunit N, chloroplastic-like isoform X1 [Miscanthus floridulus]|uniref:NAD(P)H-quinone oxidoreductase subunit N, chloroplastic-like isoform X1 n=1 Tax=Miscanthus floridulus TaxID=154761 RepID=UPI00345A4C77